MAVKERIGKVVSTSMEKTITVLVETRVQHRRFRKYINRRKRLHAHDENQEAHLGDMVKIEETRPLSKLKRWKLVEILHRNPSEAVRAETGDIG